LLRIAAGARPFRRPDGRYSASIAIDGHQECHDLESPDVARWLTRRYYESTGRLPSSASLSSTIRALAAHADIARTAEADLVRVGCNASGSSIFLDLGDSAWQGVEIRATGWQVIERPDAHFRRSAGQRALPVPSRDGSIALLRKYINVDSADLPLLVGCLTAALRPAGPHPIIFLPLRSSVPSRRRCEEDLWAEFMPDYPRIFGGLLDAVAAGMRLRPKVKLAELERMADITRWGEAAAQGAGWAPGTFVTAIDPIVRQQAP
jgi:hypothetical protein